MKRNVLLIIFVIAVSFLSLVGCGRVSQVQPESEKNATYQTISTETAKQRLETEKGIVLLDVRTVAENTEKCIPGSVLIPVGDIKTQAIEKIQDKNVTIFVYCRSGNRSTVAAQELANLGYTNVYNLGGINNWPYATESGAKQ